MDTFYKLIPVNGNHVFCYRLPRIPQVILGSVVDYFRQDLEKETVIQIWMNRKAGYYIRYPDYMRADKKMAEYRFPLGDTEDIYIMTIHSHNTMPAFFSPVDDADELSAGGLYGVIGRLDHCPEALFRFCLEGKQIHVSMSELFQTI